VLPASSPGVFGKPIIILGVMATPRARKSKAGGDPAGALITARSRWMRAGGRSVLISGPSS